LTTGQRRATVSETPTLGRFTCRAKGSIERAAIGEETAEVISLKRFLCGVAALGVTAAVAACSSSSSHSSTNTTSASQPTSGSSAASTGAAAGQATGAPIKVAIICSCSGPFGANIAPSEEVYKAWVNSVNASGGINGHLVQLSTQDDGSNPGTSVSDMNTILSGHPDAIVDLSIDSATWASTVQATNIPVIGGNNSEPAFYGNPDFYPVGTTNDASTAAGVYTAKAAGATNISYFYCAEAAVCATSIPLFKSYGQKAGVPNVFNVSISATAPNYTAQCVAASQAHVSSIFIGSTSTILDRIGADCARQGYHPIYLQQGEGFASNELTASGLNTNLWEAFNDLPYWDNVPPVQAMNAALDKYYPGLRTNQLLFSELTAMAWPAGLLLEDAVKAGGLTAGGTPGPAEIVTGLHSLKGDTLGGWAPPLTFPAGQPHPVDCWFIARIQNGTPGMVNNSQVTCEPGATT
jgi:branched-chain amino acid transport system substrate-binding protein